jgi:hypothetical protein
VATVSKLLSSPKRAVAFTLIAIVALAYLGWAAYIAASDGIGDGIGVLVSVPALIVIVCLVAAPFVAVAWLTARLVAASRASDGPSGGSGGETITTNTFPC